MKRPMAFRNWYGGDCREQIADFLRGFSAPAEPATPVAVSVPHAGWRYSGSLAAQAIRVLAGVEPETLFLFSAVHRSPLERGAVYAGGSWETPLGDVAVDEKLARELLRQLPARLVADRTPHLDEHALEVEMPFVRELLPGTSIVPVMVPAVDFAVEIGRAAASVAGGRSTAALASTDLTHYGARFGLAPAGTGPAAHAWMRANDDRILDLSEKLLAEEIVPEALTHSNACGPGALAAAVAFAGARGATRGHVLERTDSHEVAGGSSEFEMAVGYAAMVF